MELTLWDVIAILRRVQTGFNMHPRTNLIRALLLGICVTLTAPQLAYASSAKLPDYEKEAKKQAWGTCDNGQTRFSAYVAESYMLEMVVMRSDNTFYVYREMQGHAIDHHFIRDGSGLREISTLEYFRGLASGSVDYLIDIFNPGLACIILSGKESASRE